MSYDVSVNPVNPRKSGGTLTRAFEYVNTDILNVFLRDFILNRNRGRERFERPGKAAFFPVAVMLAMC